MSRRCRCGQLVCVGRSLSAPIWWSGDVHPRLASAAFRIVDGAQMPCAAEAIGILGRGAPNCQDGIPGLYIGTQRSGHLKVLHTVVSVHTDFTNRKLNASTPSGGVSQMTSKLARESTADWIVPSI